MIFDIENWLESQILALFDSSPLIPNKKFNKFFWVCWFLGKNLSNFVPSVWKFHNPYCHKCRFFMYGTKEKIKNPIVRILYLVKLLSSSQSFLDHRLLLAILLCHYLFCMDCTIHIWCLLYSWFLAFNISWFRGKIFCYNVTFCIFLHDIQPSFAFVFKKSYIKGIWIFERYVFKYICFNITCTKIMIIVLKINVPTCSWRHQKLVAS